MSQKKLLSAGLALIVFFGLAPLAVSAIAECEFTGTPTAEQLAACQQAQQAAASASAPAQQPTATAEPSVRESAPEIPTGGLPAGIKTGPSAEQMEKINQAKLKGLKSGVKGLESGLLKMEAQYKALAKSGVAITDVLKSKLTEARAMIDTIKNAATAEEIEAVDTDIFSELLEELGNGIGELKQQAAMMKGLKKAVKGMKNGISLFDKQIAKLDKQGIEVPADIAETLKMIKAIITGIEANKSWDELSALGMENFEELFDKLDDGRERIIMLARWPQVVKQLNSQLAAMDKQAAKLAATAAKLKGGEVDVSEYVANFSQGVADLKQVRDAAAAKVKAGDGLEAFDELEENFFGKIEEVYENQRVIETMAGLNKFAAEFKKGYAAAQKQIASLAKNKKKLNTAEVQNLLNQYKAKGDSILAMIKAKPLNEEAIMAAVDEFESLRTSLMDKATELAGGQEMPWEKGAPVLKEIAVPKEFDQFVTKNAEKDLKELQQAAKSTEPIKPEAGGQSLLIEAENENKSYILPLSQRPASNTKEIKPGWRPAYSGSGDWYLAAKGEWLEYKIEVPADGLYRFWIRDYVDKFQPKGVRRVVVSFDGAVYGAFAEVDKVSTGAKGDFGWHQAGSGINLTKGTHLLKVMKENTTSGAAVLDAFYLTLGSEIPAEK